MAIKAVEAADYIDAHLNELTRLARKSGLETVAYLLEVAATEAAKAKRPRKKRAPDQLH